MIGTILCVCAVVLFALLGLAVIDTNQLRWEWAGFAILAASFLPWPD